MKKVCFVALYNCDACDEKNMLVSVHHLLISAKAPLSKHYQLGPSGRNSECLNERVIQG